MKACPFCGDTREPEPMREPCEKGMPDFVMVACPGCGAQGPSAHDVAGARKLWNTRSKRGGFRAWRVAHEEDCY